MVPLLTSNMITPTLSISQKLWVISVFPQEGPSAGIRLDYSLLWSDVRIHSGIFTVSVCSGCHKKMAQMEWRKQQKFSVSQFWRQEVHELASGLPSEGRESLPCLSPSSWWFAGVFGIAGLVEVSFPSLLSCSHHLSSLLVSVTKCALFVWTPVILDSGHPQWPHLYYICSNPVSE